MAVLIRQVLGMAGFFFLFNEFELFWIFSGDDDINDVAAMGGVNLAEESQRILGSTEFVGTQIRSIKDELFLHTIPLRDKVRQIGGFFYSFFIKVFVIVVIFFSFSFKSWFRRT